MNLQFEVGGETGRFSARLQEISDQISSNGCLSPNIFAPLTNLVVQQAVVSSRHLAFLLQVSFSSSLVVRLTLDL